MEKSKMMPGTQKIERDLIQHQGTPAEQKYFSESYFFMLFKKSIFEYINKKEIMKHVKLFEQFSNDTKQYATCFQGDAYAAVGILDESQQKELQDALDRAIEADPENIDYLKIENIDVAGMGYVKHDENGNFTAMPMETNTSDYAYHITKGGESPGIIDNEYANNTDRLFELVEGQMLVMDHHAHTEILPVGEFINKYLGY